MKWERNSIDCLCFAAILNCIAFGLFGCIFFFTEVEAVKWTVSNFLSIFILFSILCSFLYYSKKTATIFVPFMVIFLSFLAGIFRKQLIASIWVLIWNMLFKVDRYYNMGWNIEEERLSIDFKIFENGIFVFMLIVIFLLSIDIAGFLYVKRIFFFSAFLLIFGMFVGKIPPGGYVFLLLFGLLGLCSMSSKSRDFRKKWKCNKGSAIIEIYCREQEEEREAVIHGGQKAAVFTIGCFFIALLLSVIFQKKFGEELLHLHPPVQNWANEIEYQVLNYNYNELFQKIPIHHGGKKRGSSGRLSNFEIQYSGKEVMKLTVDTVPKKGMYLRGFIGKDYQGTYWSEIDKQAFLEAASSWQIEDMGTKEIEQEVGNLVYSMLYEKEKSRIFSLMYKKKGKKKKSKSYLSKIKIEYIDVPGQYAYLPYFTDMGDSLFIDGDGIMIRPENQERNALYTRGFCKHSGNYYKNLSMDYFYSLPDEWRWEEKNLILEQQYAKYVRQQYLNIPTTTPQLENVCKQFFNANRGKGSINEKTTTRFIRKYLKNQASYSMKLKRVPYGQDFIEYFLYTQKEGYCIHFATAAVLMYRMLGIPARFVEGYVVWPEDFVKNKDGTYTASIPDNRAHAWAEIYYDGFGFIPVDMTPGSYETMTENSGTEHSLENIAQRKEEKKEQHKKEETINKEEDNKEKDDKKDMQEDDDTKEQDKKSDDKKDKTIKDKEQEEKENAMVISYFLNYLSFFVIIVLLILFIGFILFTGNIFYHRKKYQGGQKKLLQGLENKNRKEIIKISCKFYGYLRYSGVEQVWKKNYGQNISDREYEKLIREEFDFLKSNQYGKFQEIVQKAIYSSPQAEYIISEKEVKECNELTELMKSYLLEKLSWYKKILVKGIVG